MAADHGECAVAVRAERETCAAIISDAIDMLTDRKLRDRAAGFRIDYEQQFIAASGKKDPMSSIDVEARRLFASFHGPAVHHFQFGSIDLGDLASVLDVDEDVSFAVECGELGFAS